MPGRPATMPRVIVVDDGCAIRMPYESRGRSGSQRAARETAARRRPGTPAWPPRTLRWSPSSTPIAYPSRAGWTSCCRTSGSGGGRGRAAHRPAREGPDVAGAVPGGKFHARHGSQAQHRQARIARPLRPGRGTGRAQSRGRAGFAEDMQVGEDVDFVWRLAAAGWRTRYEPAATMGHPHRARLHAWLARRKDYGTSAAALERRHPGRCARCTRRRGPRWPGWPRRRAAPTRARWSPGSVPPCSPGGWLGLPAKGGRGRPGRPRGGWRRSRRRRDARSRPAAWQRDLPYLVAGGAAGSCGRTAAAASAGGAGARAAAARLAGPASAAGSGAVRGGAASDDIGYSLGVWQGCARAGPSGRCCPC